ncbi:AraC family transcriptional regulator [Shimia biformata]|uniref:AraC family transcriptional regulator n=1 Tax=Shimia biformata TaxID=1294299 RepID=UPI001951E09B|nr:AraC family transcriptional regulator [Shimia biformata]
MKRPVLDAPHSISPARILLALDLVSELDLSADQALMGTGLTVEQLGSPDTKTSSTQFTTVLCNLAQMTGRSDIGFLLGKRIRASVYGMFGYAMLCAPTLRAALDTGIRFQKLTGGLDNQSWHVDGQSVVLLTVGSGDLRKMGFSEPESIVLRDFHTAATAHVLQDIMGPSMRADWVGLTGAPTPHAGDMARDLQCAVRFGQANNEIRYDINLLDQPPQLANQVTATEVSQTCASLLDQMRLDAGMTRRVYHELTSNPGVFPDLEAVASKLCMTSRTLRRKLTAEGTSYRVILDEVRCALAQDYLATSDMPIGDIAFALGFDDTQSFRRAYRRWTGASPSQARSGYPK